MKHSMPKRPTQHQVEDLSITAFRSILPREWVFREKSKDYGIDGEVEIFDEDGHATGLVFLIQLKATDSIDEKKQKRVQLDNAVINYYKTLELSVLIVRYIEPLKSIYFKWAHKIDRYGMKEGSNSFSFLMREDEKWKEDSAFLLYEELTKLKEIRKRNSLLPLKLYLDFEFDSFLDYNSSILKSYLREYIRKSDSEIELVLNEEEAFCTVQMTKNTLSSSIVGLAGFTVHDYNMVEYSSIDDFISSIFVIVSISLFEIGKGIDATYIFEKLFLSDAFPSILNDPEIALHVIESYISIKQEYKSYEILKTISEETQEEIYPYFMTLLVKTKNLDLRKKVLEDKLEILVSQDDSRLTGVFFYNLANTLHNKSMYFESVKNYNRALKYYPHYCQEDYIFKELGGSLFELRRYKLSAKCYKVGLDIKKDLKTTILYADSLMLSGEYGESKKYMEEYFIGCEKIDDEWILKDVVLNYVINVLKISSQKRCYYQAINIYEMIDNKNGSTEESLLQILQIDALSPLIWYNLGQIYYQETQYEKALYGFLICGLVNGYDPESWYKTFIMALYTEKLMLLEPIIKVGYQKNGEEFIRLIYEHIDKMDTSYSESMHAAIEGIIYEEEKRNIEPTIRVHDGVRFQDVKNFEEGKEE